MIAPCQALCVLAAFHASYDHLRHNQYVIQQSLLQKDNEKQELRRAAYQQKQMNIQLEERYALQEQLKNELQERYALHEQLNNELQACCAQQSLNERLEHQLAAIDSFKVLSRRVRIYMSLTQVCRTGCV